MNPRKKIMSTVINFIKLLKPSQIKTPAIFQAECLQYWRGFADKSIPNNTTKQVVVQGANKDDKLRVRRARPADVPRVLRFVRENARVAWPSFVSAQSHFHLIIGDYVARALAQGHSMVAEQLEPKRGWTQIRGLAICTTVCPWDAMMLEQWAKCVKCKRSRQLVHFTAHCLRAPGLHDKYRVHNILQVILIVPPENPRATEIVHMLAKNTIKRGREVGLPLLRFDVVNDPVARALDQLNLVKEWELSYNLLPSDLKERDEAMRRESDSEALKDETSYDQEVKQAERIQNKGHFIAVYTVTNQIDKL